MMILYSGPTCPFSQMSRIILNEKGCDFRVESIDVDGIMANKDGIEAATLSPYGELPVLSERDLMLYNVYVVNEYIDERFPHPQLMPTDPVGRARMRLFMYVLERELFPYVRILENRKSTDARRELARSHLRQNLEVLSFRVGETKHAPILWRLPHYGIELPATAAKLETYAQRLFTRQSFIDSMTAQERTMRQ